MQRPSARGLLDLLAAAETVSDDQRVLRGLANARQQHTLADAHRDVVMLALEAERAGHAAAAGIEMLEVEAHLLQDLFLRLELHDRFVMAVALDDRFALQLRHSKAVAGVVNE